MNGLTKLLCFMLILSFFPSAHSVQASNQADYTFLVYMNGSDLESKDLAGAATSDLKEMMQVGSSDRLNIVVETGGTKQWANDQISNQVNQRWLVRQGALEKVKDDLGSRNMGDSATLKDFIVWGTQNYPAKKYALIFWDHGAGSVHGFGADELHDGDSLTLDEIQSAMQTASQETKASFEMIGFDACLMATVETASMMAPFGRYLVASEELEPGHGWNYTYIMEALVNNPGMTGNALGKTIADGYRMQAQEQETDQEITLSVVALAKVAEVEQALNRFIQKINPELVQPDRIHAVMKARSKSEDYGSSGAHGGNTDMVDLSDLAHNASTLYPAEANQLTAAVKEAVVYNLTSVSKPNAKGLSIYFPYKDKENFESNAAKYEQLPFSSEYKKFVKKYISVISSDKTPVQFENKSPAKLESGGPTDPSAVGESYAIKLKPEELEQISEIYSVLATYDKNRPGKLIFLGMDNDVELNESTGVLKDNFTGNWVTLNGHFVSMFLTEEGEDYAEYSIPALLNGESVDILVLYSYKTGEDRIIGAWRGIDEKTGMADKNIIKIKSGDKIVPLFYSYDESTDKEGFEEGDAFIIEGKPELVTDALPAGNYLYGFYIKDLSQNESFSDFVEVVLEEDQASRSSAPANSGSAASGTIHVKMDGVLRSYEQPPVLINGSTMVPLRAIFEDLGAAIEWNAETGTVTAVKPGITVSLTIGAAAASVNGRTVQLAQAAEIVNGKTMVPIRFVSEAMGAGVNWDSETGTVSITRN